jgi:DNA-binding CsgD family transcriptional regulator
MSPGSPPVPAPTTPSTASGELLVGRERELATLRDALALALVGQGGLLVIGGAAGIGKTALAETLLAEARAGGALTLVGRCYDRAETPPYGLFHDLLRGYEPTDNLPSAPFSPWRGTDPAGSQAAFYHHVLTFFRTVAAHRPLVILFDDLQWADQASLDLLRVLARTLPTWQVLALVTYRADGIDRHHPLFALLPLLERESAATHLTLHPLDHEAVATLVRARYPLPVTAAEHLTTYLTARSEGNALFVMQLLRALEEQGILRRDGLGWVLGDIDGLGLPVPLQRVIETRLARLDEATRALLEVAAVLGQTVTLRLWASAAAVDAAAVERATALAGTTGLLEASADGAGVRFVHALIREAVYAGIFPPRRRALHQAAGEILATIPATDPDATAYHFAQGGDPRAVAWLLRAAERAERVFAMRIAAGRLTAALALTDEDNRMEEEERGWLLLRLAQLHRHGDHRRGLAALEEAERVAWHHGDRTLAAQVLFQRGHLHCQHGQLRQGVAELAAGVAALDALSPDEWARGQALAHNADLLDAETGRGTLALFLAVTGRYAEAGALVQQRASRTPTTGGIRPSDAPAYQAWAIVQGAAGQIAAAQQAYVDARTAYAAAGNAILVASMGMQELRHIALPYQADALAERQGLARQAVDALSRAGGMSPIVDIPPTVAALPLWFIEGRWAEARELMALRDLTEARGLTALRDLAGRWRGPWRGLLAGVAAALARAQGEPDVAWAIVRAVLPGGPTTAPGGDDYRETLPLQRLAALLALDTGDLPTARDWLAAHDRWLAWSGAIQGRAEGQLIQAAYRHAAGEPAAALIHTERALVAANEPRQPLAVLAARRLLGELAAAAGDSTGAATHLHAALALADDCAAPYERALTLLALADLHRVTGENVAARRLATAAREVGAALGATPTTTRAEIILAGLPAVQADATGDGATAGSTTDLLTGRADATTYPAGLSAREVEILRHVAAGRANRDIAATLSLSEHTVRAHVRHIFTKTGTENRAAATAFAFHHHLT